MAPSLLPPTTPDFPSQGQGLPDLANLRAFLAHGGQALTYGVGTWHAPMAVVGAVPIDFVVVQFCNGVAEEDCEEIEIDGDGMSVAVNL